jgi:uncharacterized damage-inducible protein DinB
MKFPLLACLLATTLVLVGISYESSANTVTTAYNADSIKVQLIKDWERAKAYTKEYLDAMPEDGLGLKPTPDIRSFAEQMLHLAGGNIGLGSTGLGKERIYAGKNLEKMDEFKTKEALTKVVMESYDFVIDGLKSLDASKLEEQAKMGQATLPRLTILGKAFEHQTHHRGQCTIYLRLKGVKPPAERLF